ERPGRPGGPAAPLRRADEDQTARAVSTLDAAGPRRQRPAVPPGGRGAARDRERDVSSEPGVAMQGLPLSQPMLGVAGGGVGALAATMMQGSSRSGRPESNGDIK